MFSFETINDVVYGTYIYQGLKLLIPVEENVESDKLVKRMLQQIAEVDSKISKLQTLMTPDFYDKAPSHVVANNVLALEKIKQQKSKLEVGVK